MKILISCLIVTLNFSPLFASSRQMIFDILTDVKPYIDKKFDEAVVETYPFPHIVIHEIFPDHLYHLIHKYWPDQGEFVSNGKRLILPTTYGSLESTTVPTEQKIFWRIFGEVIVDRYVKQNIIRKLAPYFSLKSGMDAFNCDELVHFENFHQLRQNFISLDVDNFAIPPHKDQLNLLAALLFYLPEDEDHQNFGTTFYEGKPSYNPNSIQPPHKLKEVKTIPYSPNTMVTFLQTPFSWHGVKNQPSKTCSYQRKVYIAPIFLSPEFMEKHYTNIYARHAFEDYFFDHRFLCKKNWSNIWGHADAYN